MENLNKKTEITTTKNYQRELKKWTKRLLLFIGIGSTGAGAVNAGQAQVDLAKLIEANQITVTQDNTNVANTDDIYRITNNGDNNGEGDKEKLNPTPTVKIVNGEVVFTEGAILPGNLIIVKGMQKQLKVYNPYLFGVYNTIATRIVKDPNISETNKLTATAVLFYNLHFRRNAQGIDEEATGSNPALAIYKQTLPKKDRETVDHIMKTHDIIAANRRKGKFMSMKDRDALANIYGEYGKLTGSDIENYLLTMYAQMTYKDWERRNFMDPNNLINNFATTKSDELSGMLYPMSGALQTPYYSSSEILEKSPAELVKSISVLAKEIVKWASKKEHTPDKPDFVSKDKQKIYNSMNSNTDF